MKFIKMDVISTELLTTWWNLTHHAEVRKLLLVNESKAPKWRLRLKRGGKA